MKKLPFYENQPYQKYSPNVFDDSLSLYEQIIAFIEFLNKVIENSNEVTDEILLIRKQFEEFKNDIENKVMPDNLKKILEEWLESGKLEGVINDALFKGKSTIITSELEPQEVNDTTYWYKITDEIENTIPTLDGDIGYDEL